MHAAALGGRIDARRPRMGQRTRGATTLRSSGTCASSPEPAFEADLAQFVDDEHQHPHVDLARRSCRRCSGFNEAAAARAAGQPVGREPVIDESGVTVPDDEDTPPAGTPFDVEALLYQCGTVYMLGAQDAQVAPLVTALTGHIARTARQIAGRQPGGRLDPPLTLDLDEAALICPIPLDEWTADMGGRNVTHPHRRPVTPAAAKAVGARRRGRDPQQRRHSGDLRRHPGPGRSAGLLDPGRRARGTHRHATITPGKVISETTQRVPALTPGADRPAGRRAGLADPPRHAPGHRARSRWRGSATTSAAVQRQPAASPPAWRSAPRSGPAGRPLWLITGASSGPSSPSWSRRSQQALQEWREQRQEAARRREAAKAQELEAQRSEHERIDPQPAGPEHVE